MLALIQAAAAQAAQAPADASGFGLNEASRLIEITASLGVLVWVVVHFLGHIEKLGERHAKQVNDINERNLRDSEENRKTMEKLASTLGRVSDQFERRSRRS